MLRTWGITLVHLGLEKRRRAPGDVAPHVEPKTVRTVVANGRVDLFWIFCALAHVQISRQTSSAIAFSNRDKTR
jgi:hypothetical protein